MIRFMSSQAPDSLLLLDVWDHITVVTNPDEWIGTHRRDLSVCKSFLTVRDALI